MQASRAQTAEPALDFFIDWSQRLRWEALPAATRAMVKQELLAKFKSNVHLAGVTADAAEKLALQLLDFENIPDVSPFLAQLETFALE